MSIWEEQLNSDIENNIDYVSEVYERMQACAHFRETPINELIIWTETKFTFSKEQKI